MGSPSVKTVGMRDLLSLLTAQGAQLILNLNGSPFHMGKSGERARVVGKRAKKVGVPIIYANLVGGAG